MYGIEIPKQRGIYSEILTTEDTENLNVSLNISTHFFVSLTRPFLLFIESVDLRSR